MRRFAISLVMFAVLLQFTACTSTGFSYATRTVANLDEKNFRVIKTNVRGASSRFSILGILGPYASIPIISPTYAEAMAGLHRIAQIEGKAEVPVNLTVDVSYSNFLIFSIPRITICADIIEFDSRNVHAHSGKGMMK